jgi:hypothetical protein
VDGNGHQIGKARKQEEWSRILAPFLIQKIPNLKHQITNKSQYSITQTIDRRKAQSSCQVEFWSLGFIRYLGFGIKYLQSSMTPILRINSFIQTKATLLWIDEPGISITN